MKRRAMIFDSVYGFFKSMDLMPNLVFHCVNVLFVVFYFTFDLNFKLVHVAIHKLIHNSVYLSFIDFLSNFGLFIIHVELIIK